MPLEALEVRTLLSVSATIPALVMDPVDRLATSAILGDWSTDTLEGWTVNNSGGLSFSGGLMTVSSQNGGSNPLQIDIRNTAAPYLDFGYFDYLQIRMQLPAGVNPDVVFSFGTLASGQSGFAASRNFTIPSASLATDGAMHTYRLDLGLVIWWRDTLNDLRIQPLGTTGTNQAAIIDYVEVGDLPGDVLGINTNLNFLNDATGTVTLATAQRLESKHFAVWWDPAVSNGPAFNTATHGRNALRMLEESYQVYYKVLGFDEQFNVTGGSGARLKVNLITWYDGYWMSSLNGRGYMNVGTGGLLDEGRGNPLPHEFGHVTDGQQPGNLAGGHWESHANFLRDQRTIWFSPLFSTGNQSEVYLNPIVWSNYRQDQQRMIYEDFRIHQAVQDWGPSLGLPENIAAQLWSEGGTGVTAYQKLASLLPGGMNIKDVSASLLRHWPLLDFTAKTQIQGLLWTNTDEKNEYEYRTGSPLLPAADLGANWFRVPFDRAPEKYAFMWHELTPTAGSTSVTVNLRGLDVLGTDEDWRWSMIAVDAAGNPRYSNVFAPGTQTFNLNAGENRVILFVMATPGSTTLDLTSFYNTKPNDKNADRLRYPYEVNITGAVPKTDALTPANGTFHAHSNGGGLVENTATVAASVYVGPNARVLDTAQVSGNARIEDYAVISGNARVRDSAVVSGYAWVNGNGIVENNARVRDHAMITGNSRVQGNGMAAQYARLGDTAIVGGNAIARGNSYLWGSGSLTGYAIADHDYSMNYALTDGMHFNHIPFDDYFNAYFAQSQKKAPGLVASYRVEESSGEVLWDEFGALHAWLKGSPTRINDTTLNSNVLEFNGSTQYGVLDRNAVDFSDGTFAMWLRPTSADADETLLYFGSNATNYLKLTGRDANGLAHLTVSVNGVVRELVSSTVIPLNQWTHLAVTFSGGTARFYINGVGNNAALSFRPMNVLTADDYVNAQPVYLARDGTGNFFTGRLEDMRFYNVALPEADVQNEFRRAGARIGQFFYSTPQTFDGATTMMESGVHNGSTQTMMAWVKPAASPDVATYAPIFDSDDERTGSANGSGMGLDNGIIKVRLNGGGIWNTNIAVTLNAWQQIAVTFNGSSAQLFVNGVQRASTNYSGATPTGKNYRIGYGQTGDTTTRTFFNGQIYDARIYDRIVTPTGKFDLPPTPANDTATVPGNTATRINVLANDTGPNPVPLSVSAVTQAAHGTVSITAGATSVTYTPVSGYTGPDTFTYTASDGFGGTAVATVNLTVQVTLASIVITPASTSLGNGGNATFNAVGYDQVGGVMVPTPTFAWTIVSGTGTLVPGGGTNASATFTAGTNTELVTIQASNGTVSGIATIAVTSALAPTFAVTPAATPNPATTSTSLSVLGADAAGEAGLVYQWSVLGTPPAGVNFSANNSNAAKNSTATFTKAGNYQLQVKATNPSGRYITGIVNVVVSQVLTSVSVSPPSTTLATSGSAQFTATALDQFGQPLAPQPAIAWSIANGTGSVNGSGLYQAPFYAGSATVRAAVGAIAGTASVTITPEEIAWYQANASSGTTLTDSSGHGKNATTSGAASWVAGAAGNALRLTGGFGQMPNGILNGVNDFTVSAWVKLDSIATWTRIFDFGTGTTVNMFLTPRADSASGTIRFAITVGGGGAAEQRINGTTALATGSWQHVAVTIAGSLGTLYVNGAAVGTNNAITLHPSDLGNTTQNYIGKSQYGDPALQGSVDDFRLYGRALSSAEIQLLMKPTVAVAASGSPNPTSGPASLLTVLGADALSGEAGLTYAWATTGSPPAPVQFSANGTNAAKNSAATFTKPGTYNFQVTITNSQSQSVTSTTSVIVTTAVVGRRLFYGNSFFDTAHDAAIAADKIALLPGQTATFANISSYSRGINGVMVDIAGPVGALTAADFAFMVGNNNSPTAWSAAPAPSSITLRPGAGTGGSTRVELVWNDNAIAKQWLQVTVKANANTGLAFEDVFYFGNAIGDAGNSTTDLKVNATDEIITRLGAAPSVAITHVLDFNRDGTVNGLDVGLTRDNYTYYLNELKLIQSPAGPGAAGSAGGAALGPAVGTGPMGAFVPVVPALVPLLPPAAPSLARPPLKQQPPLPKVVTLPLPEVEAPIVPASSSPLGVLGKASRLVKATLVKLALKGTK